MKNESYYIYRLYNKSQKLLYVGRTINKVQKRVKGHIAKGYYRDIQWRKTIEYYDYATVDSKADMILYEIYFINADKPKHNVGDKTDDKLTVELDLNFTDLNSVDELDYNIDEKQLKRAKQRGTFQPTLTEPIKLNAREEKTLKKAVNNLPQ